ncbi:MAG: DUF402 domain-containing protein [Mollicutes bacterium PWAP]|nr:DUF402 domain-containing protein [Mollicutes bacterium PWAP]
MKLITGKMIKVQAFKQDGTLYRQWNGVRVIESSKEYILLFMYKTKVKELNNQKWIVREPTLWLLPRDDSFYNVLVLLRKTGLYYYVNLASPPIIDEDTIRYIDYDLDIKKYPNRKSKVVDQREYKENSIKMNYSKKLMKVIEDTLLEVLELIKNRDIIFDPEYIKYINNDLIDQGLLSKSFEKINWKKEY